MVFVIINPIISKRKGRAYGKCGENMKFIHIADVHLGMTPQKGTLLGEKRAKELWDTFKNVVEQCEKQQVDILFIAGDLFHRQPLKKEVLEVSYIFSTLTHTKVVLIAGNHDYLTERSAYFGVQWSDNVIFLKEKEVSYVDIPELRTRAWGCSYWQKEIEEPCYNKIDKQLVTKDRYHVLLAHGGDNKHIPMDYKEMVGKGFDYIALGHIHKPYLFTKETGVVASKIAYAGSLEPLDISETKKHGYIKGIIDEKGTRIQFVPAAKREYISLQVKVNETTTAIAFRNGVKKIIEKSGAKHMYRVVVIGEKDEESTWTKEMLDGIGNIVEVVDNTKVAFDVDKLLEENKTNAIGMFIEKLQNTQQNNKALEYGLMALLHSDESVKK